ncbi:MAG: glycosyltransferase family 2 protein [Planctomycetota bacterium]
MSARPDTQRERERAPVTVYVIGYKGDRWLPDCVGTLRTASATRLDLVLIDNVENTALDQLPLELFETRVVSTPRPMGFADAHNFGVVAAPPRGEYVVLLNQDTRSQPGWIDAAVRCMEARPELGVLSPGLRTYDDRGWDPNFLTCVLGPGAAEHDLDTQRALQVTDAVTGAAMVVRRSMLAELGLFDPVFGSYYEDYDFCVRARAAGWEVGYLPRARVQHFSGSATTTRTDERRRTQQILRNRVIASVRASDRRGWTLLAHFARDLPRNLLRGLARTPSSQPVACTLRAHGQLLAILPRLASARRDRARWRAHLDAIGWGHALSQTPAFEAAARRSAT